MQNNRYVDHQPGATDGPVDVATDGPVDVESTQDRQLSGTAGTDAASDAFQAPPAEDPAWRLTSWVLPVGGGASALLTAAQAGGGGLGLIGYPAAVALALLTFLLLRDARRRAARRRWARDEVHEYALPLGLLLVTLVLLTHGADAFTLGPALLALVPVAWEFARAPQAERLLRLFPRALPVLNGAETAPAEEHNGRVEAIVRAVLDGLPPDIAARLEPWSVDVQDEFPTPTPGQVVYGCCFYAAHVIAIYRRPHLRHAGGDEALREAVTYTVLHEVAHALGLDESGVRRLGWLSDRQSSPDRDASVSSAPRGTIARLGLVSWPGSCPRRLCPCRSATRSSPMEQQQQTRQHSQSQTIDAPADQVFAFVSEIGNLPTYLPPITVAEAVPPDQVRLQGKVPGHGKIEGQGYYRVYKDERRMEWGANFGRDYSGSLTVEEQGQGRSELTVELSFGPRSVEPRIEQESGPERDSLQEGVGATLESIRRRIEGEGGKVTPPPPSPPSH